MSEIESTRQLWIEKGYEHFAIDGPDNFSINKLSKLADLSRASFYHHFGDVDIFIEELLAMHLTISDIFIDQGTELCNRLIPDLYDLLEQNPIPLRFALQLFHHRSTPGFNFIFVKSYATISKKFALKLFADHLNLHISATDAYHLWITLGEAWYSRLDPEDLSSATLQKHAEEIMQTLSLVIKSPLYAELHRID